ncbi:MAG: shikimate kinase [Acidaminococcaceae bacterium]
MKNIVLVGMPGSGKTTIGKILAAKLGRVFCDADHLLEEWEGRTIKELFAVSEEKFREAETRTIKKLINASNQVIATGGGVVKKAENMELLNAGGIIFFIDRSPELICADVDVTSRPLLAAGRERIFTLYKERLVLYQKYKHFAISNNGEPEAAVLEILNILKKVEQ